MKTAKDMPPRAVAPAVEDTSHRAWYPLVLIFAILALGILAGGIISYPVIALMDTAEVYAPLRERLWLTVLLMGTLLLGAGASVGLLWRRQRVQFYREKAAVAVAEAIRESEGRLQVALEASNAGAWSWEVASNVSTWDERYQAQYGFGPEEPASQEAWLARVLPEDRQRLQTRLRALLEPGADSVWNEEFRALHPVKGERWMAGIGRVERDPSGRAVRVAGLNLDITERKRAELRIVAFADLGRRLSTVRSPSEAARTIFASADKFWKWDCGVLDLQMPGAEQIETALACDRLDGQRREVALPNPVGPPSAMTRRVMAQGAELILRKPDEPPATDTIRFGDASRLSASLMCVPVRAENRTVGVLSIQSYTPNAYTPEDLRTLQALADYCGGALNRLRMENLLHGSEARYRRLFEAAKDGVLILDAETGMVVDVNPFLVQLLGISKEAFLGRRVWELGSFKDIVASYDSFKELQEKEHIRYDDKPLKTAGGRRIDVEFVSNVYQVNHLKVIQCNVRDITERKRTEWLGQIYRDQLRALSAHIETMREEERTRISREIHDDLGQMLTGIKMDMRWMEHRLDEFGEDRRVNPILDKLVAAGELIDATVKTVQRIAAELRPGMLDKLGLPITLQNEATRFEERTGIACRLVVPGETLPLRPEAATAFFRIFQEALTNVTRHSKATAVEVELQPEADGCRLEIRDNGQGMAGIDSARSKSLGLLGMQERAASLGGGVSFAPRPGGGTVVTVRIPSSPTNA